MIGIRKCLDFFFTQRELKILDDVMPETTKREEDQEALDDVNVSRLSESIEICYSSCWPSL